MLYMRSMQNSQSLACSASSKSSARSRNFSNSACSDASQRIRYTHDIYTWSARDKTFTSAFCSSSATLLLNNGLGSDVAHAVQSQRKPQVFHNFSLRLFTFQRGGTYAIVISEPSGMCCRAFTITCGSKQSYVLFGLKEWFMRDAWIARYSVLPLTSDIQFVFYKAITLPRSTSHASPPDSFARLFKSSASAW